MEKNKYIENLCSFMTAMEVFKRIFSIGILDKEQVLKIQHNLQMKYEIKDNSLYVFK